MPSREDALRLRLPFEMRGGLLLALNTFSILLLAFPVQVLVARYLGPEGFGAYAFVLSFAGLARVFVSLSLPDVLVPLAQSDKDDGWLGSAWWLRQLAAGLLSLTALGYAWLHPETERGTLLLLAVVAYHFSDHEIYSTWCRAHRQLGRLVLVDFGGTLAGLAARLAVVALGGSIVMLMATYIWEQLARLLIAATLYFGAGRPFLKPFRASRQQARQLLSRAWPIWLGALMTAAYARLDQVLLGSLLPDTSQLGQYSVALRLIEALTAASVALFVVYLPLLSQPQCEIHLQRYHDLALWVSLLLVIPLSLVLKPLVLLLYGERYRAAVDLAWLGLWLLPVSYVGLCRTAYAYSHHLQKLELGGKTLSLLASLLANLWVIPRYGASGVMATSLVVQWTAFLVMALFLPAYRPTALCCLRALYLPGVIRRLREWISSR